MSNDDDYTVGYARPPKDHQFPKGKSGNPNGGRKPKLTARQVGVARQMYDEKDADDKRRYTVAEIAETFHVSRKTIYRHLEPTPTATASPAE